MSGFPLQVRVDQLRAFDRECYYCDEVIKATEERFVFGSLKLGDYVADGKNFIQIHHKCMEVFVPEGFTEAVREKSKEKFYHSIRPWWC